MLKTNHMIQAFPVNVNRHVCKKWTDGRSCDLGLDGHKDIVSSNRSSVLSICGPWLK